MSAEILNPEEYEEEAESGIRRGTLVIGIVGLIALLVIGAVGYKLTTADKTGEVAPSTDVDTSACAMDVGSPSGGGVDSVLAFVNSERDGSGEDADSGWFDTTPSTSDENDLFGTTGFNVLDTCGLPTEEP